MGKIDVLFHEIISDKDMVNAFDYEPDDYTKIDKGIQSRNKYVKAIANMLLQYDKKHNSFLYIHIDSRLQYPIFFLNPHHNLEMPQDF